MQIHVSNYYNEKTRFLIKEAAGWGGSATFASKPFDSVVMVVLRVHQTLTAVIQLALKFSCDLPLSYMVCLYLWLTGKKCIQNAVKHLMWGFFVNQLTAESR